MPPDPLLSFSPSRTLQTKTRAYSAAVRKFAIAYKGIFCNEYLPQLIPATLMVKQVMFIHSIL